MRECKSVSLSERRINSSLLLTSHTIAVGWEDQRVFTRSHMTNGKLSEGMKWSIHETYKNVDWIKRTAPFVKQKKMFVYPCASRVNSSHLSWHSFGALDRHGQHRQAVQTLWEKKRERERGEQCFLGSKLGLDFSSHHTLRKSTYGGRTNIYTLAWTTFTPEGSM